MRMIYSVPLFYLLPISNCPNYWNYIMPSYPEELASPLAKSSSVLVIIIMRLAPSCLSSSPPSKESSQITNHTSDREPPMLTALHCLPLSSDGHQGPLQAGSPCLSSPFITFLLPPCRVPYTSCLGQPFPILIRRCPVRTHF